MSAEPLNLRSLRRMFEGVVPAVMCSASAEGVPHLCFVSQVEYVDEQHIALTVQFFNRTRRNILATRRAALTVDDPYTAAGVRMQLSYCRTETEGALFQRMKAKLAGIASHSGMEKVFHLQGVDIYAVHDVQHIAGRRELTAPTPRCDLAWALRAVCDEMVACTDTAQLIDTVLHGLERHLRIDHAMLLILDQTGARLVTVASRGYAESGIGSEIPLGQGVAGIAAVEGVPLRIGHMTLWQAYARAVRVRTEELGFGSVADREIPLPGLTDPRSQLAVPLRLFGQVQGVLLVESEKDQHFSYDDEDALAVLAGQLALALQLIQKQESDTTPPPAIRATAPHGAPLLVRHHAYDNSIFLGNDYLIKGVAGAILRKLVADHLLDGRTEFSNRELRLDPTLGLPDVADNLEVRLLLLQRRLQERQAPLQIEKAGRGRLRLVLQQPLRLESVLAS